MRWAGVGLPARERAAGALAPAHLARPTLGPQAPPAAPQPPNVTSHPRLRSLGARPPATPPRTPPRVRGQAPRRASLRRVVTLAVCAVAGGAWYGGAGSLDVVERGRESPPLHRRRERHDPRALCVRTPTRRPRETRATTRRRGGGQQTSRYARQTLSTPCKGASGRAQGSSRARSRPPAPAAPPTSLPLGALSAACARGPPRAPAAPRLRLPSVPCRPRAPEDDRARPQRRRPRYPRCLPATSARGRPRAPAAPPTSLPSVPCPPPAPRGRPRTRRTPPRRRGRAPPSPTRTRPRPARRPWAAPRRRCRSGGSSPGRRSRSRASRARAGSRRPPR
ncbi:MAG: hypothetical protein QOG35_238 [Solirubrobacteraceae bacterium]|nr:hypothetical protein [Solirubrobacteraceae bacterium]